MAILNKCCCCGLKTGSVLSAIYSIVFAVISIAISAYILYKEGLSGEGKDFGVFVINVIQVLIYFAILIVSIILLFSIAREDEKLFTPYIIVMAIFIIVQFIAMILVIVRMIRLRFNGMYLFGVLFDILGIALNILCVICVKSYQEILRDNAEISAPATNYA